MVLKLFTVLMKVQYRNDDSTFYYHDSNMINRFFQFVGHA